MKTPEGGEWVGGLFGNVAALWCRVLTVADPLRMFDAGVEFDDGGAG